MYDYIPPNKDVLREALDLSDIVLRHIELSEIPLSNIALKASRLARLLNDFDYQKIMEYETGGYPTTPNGIPPEVWRLAVLAGRTYQEKVLNDVKPLAYTNSIEDLESQIDGAKIGLTAAKDRDISISSSNPLQYVHTPLGNKLERDSLQNLIATLSRQLASRRSFIYSYVQRKHYELKFSGVVSDVFSRIRETVDTTIGLAVPDAVRKFTAIHQNLLSNNPEDWSNAVHSCRRILQSLADAVFPAQSEDRIKQLGGKEQHIKLGSDHYVNRLCCFVEDQNESKRFTEIVGSHLRYLGERLDSIFQAAQKGSHGTIATRAEADRYVVYTYIVVGDILSLWRPSKPLRSNDRTQVELTQAKAR